jgi:hypothetical protein
MKLQFGIWNAENIKHENLGILDNLGTLGIFI